MLASGNLVHKYAHSKGGLLGVTNRPFSGGIRTEKVMLVDHLGSEVCSVPSWQRSPRVLEGERAVGELDGASKVAQNKALVFRHQYIRGLQIEVPDQGVLEVECGLQELLGEPQRLLESERTLLSVQPRLQVLLVEVENQELPLPANGPSHPAAVVDSLSDVGGEVGQKTVRYLADELGPEPYDTLVRHQARQDQPLVLVSVAHHRRVLVSEVEEELEGVELLRVREARLRAAPSHDQAALPHSHRVGNLEVRSLDAAENGELKDVHVGAFL